MYIFDYNYPFTEIVQSYDAVTKRNVVTVCATNSPCRYQIVHACIRIKFMQVSLQVGPVRVTLLR